MGREERYLQVQDGDIEDEDTFITTSFFLLVAVGERRWEISECVGNKSEYENEHPVCNSHEINPYSSRDNKNYRVKR